MRPPTPPAHGLGTHYSSSRLSVHISRRQGWGFGHHLGHRLHGPVEGARTIGDPSGDILAMMGADMSTHEMYRPDGFRNLPVEVFQKGNAFCLPFAVITRPIDLT